MTSSVIGALRVNLGIDSAAFSDGLKNAQAGLGKFGSAVKVGLAAVATGVAAAGAGMAMAIKGTVDAADEMSKAAVKVGVPIEELSRLKYAADLSGVSFEGLQTGIKKLSRNMVEAGTGTGAAADAFKTYGIAVKNADGSLKSSSEVMAEIADKMAAMPDGAEQTAMSYDLMGKSGADMIPLLNGGAAALRETLGEADRFGEIFTPDMGANAEVFNDNISRIKGTFASVTAELTAALLPALVQLSEMAVDIARWFADLSPQTKTFAAGVTVLAVAFAALAIPIAVVAVAVGVIGAPFLAVAAAVVAVTAAVVAFWPEIKQLGAVIMEFTGSALAALKQGWADFMAGVDAVGQSISTFVSGAMATLAQAFEGMKAIPAEIATAFRALADDMLQIGADIMDGLWQGIKSKVSSVGESISGVAQGIKDRFTNFFDIQSPSRVMMGVGENIVAGLGQGMESMSDSVKGIADSIGKTIGDAFGKVITGSMKAKDALKQVASQILSMLANSAIKSIFGGGGLGGGLGGLFKGFGGFFADGGTLGAGQWGIAGEAGAEIVRGPASITPMRDMMGGEIVVRGVFVDDNGVIMGIATSIGQQAVQAGARAAVSEVKTNFADYSRQMTNNGGIS